MEFFLLTPFIVQMLVIGIDEFYFHLRRGLPKWERWGHPLDTLTVLVCFVVVLYAPFTPFMLKVYIALAVFSCVFVTKDEFVHKDCCPASEQWLHAVLFINHPVVLTSAGLLWPIIDAKRSPTWLSGLFPHAELLRFILLGQTVCIALFLLYQTVYWNFLYGKTANAGQ